MKDGNHVHNESNPQGLHKHKKLMVFGVIAIVIAIAAYDLGQTATETANINNVFEIVVNNTNLAPLIHGVPGTGERVSGVVYYTNRSPIQILVFAHAANVSQTAFVQLTINGTVVLPQSGRPLGGAEQSNRSISAIIPKYSNYSVIIENEHHYEWREYPILSGKNGTLSINQTNVINQTVSDAQLNTKVNKSGDTMTGNLTINITGNNRALNLNVPSLGSGAGVILSMSGTLSTGVGDGKAFSLFADNESFARGMFYTDGSYSIGGGGARDVFLSRGGANRFLLSSDRTSTGKANMTITGLSGTGNEPVFATSNGTLIRVKNVSQENFDTIFVNSIAKNDTSKNNTIILNDNYACSDRNGSSCFFYSSPNSNTYLRFDNSTPQIRMLTQGETFFPWSRLNIEPTVFDFTMENDEIDNYINIADRLSLHANNKNTFGSADYILQTYNAGAGLDKERHMFFINNTDRVNIDFTNTTINNDVIISNATGSGNTFACFDPSGKLFSSLTPCVP